MYLIVSIDVLHFFSMYLFTYYWCSVLSIWYLVFMHYIFYRLCLILIILFLLLSWIQAHVSFLLFGLWCVRSSTSRSRCGSRIWSRGAQLPRPKVADIAEWSRASKASYLQPGSGAHLRSLEAFELLMLKYAFYHILETRFLSFLISTSRPKT